MSVMAARASGAVERLKETRTLAYAGIALGLLGFALAIPPANVQSAGIPLTLGLVAALLGVAAAARDEKRLGVWAIAAAVGGTLAALWIQSRDPDAVETVLTAGLLASMLRFATPLAFAALGGIVSERSGIVNIGLEGMMLSGAFFGIWASIWSGSWVVGVLMAMVFGGLLALIHAFFCIHLMADQIVSGFAVNLLALGLTGFLYESFYPTGINAGQAARVPLVDFSFLRDVPLVGGFLGPVFGSLSVLVWLMLILVVVVYVVLFKTTIGLRLRAAGEHPRALDAVGISVIRTRYAAVVVSGMLAALGGAFLSIGFVGNFAENMTSGRGFIALAAVIFGKWRPGWAFVATLMFGFGFALAIPLQRVSDVSSNWISTVPYVLTLVAVAGLIGRSIPPAAVGRPYRKQ